MVFASLAIVGKVVYRELPPTALVACRIVGAAAIFALISVVRRGPWVRDARDLREFALLGGLGVLANQSLFLLGLRYTTAINASILVSTIPVFTVLGSLLTGQERASPTKLAGIAAAAAGVVYLVGPDRISLAPDLALGNALIVLGMMGFSAYLLRSKAILERHSPLTVTTYVMLFSALGVLPLGAIGFASVDPGRIGALTWALVAYIVLFPTVLAYFANVWALGRSSSNLVAAYIYLQPLLTAAVAPAVLEGEEFTARTVMGGLAIFGGLALVIWAETAQRRRVPMGALPSE